MSGIAIDVATKTDSAKKDLEALNKRLIDLVKNSNSTGSALGKVKISGLGNINKELRKTVDGFGRIKTSGTTSLKSVNTSASTLSDTLSSIKSSVVALGTAFLALKGANAFNKVADDLTNVQNRIKLVTDSTQDLIRTQQRLFALSQETRSSFAGTANTFVDFSKSLETVGVNQQRIFNVVKTIQQAGALSGSSAESVNAALLQLGQGIASGTLRGEELNSVMEQMKYLGIGLQQTLGKNAGELRKFAEEGMLTTELLLTSLEKMSSSTNADFNKMSITVEQASTTLRSAIAYAIGDFNKFYGFSDSFAKRLGLISKSISRFSSEIFSEIFIVKQGIKNYINNFNLFDAVELTVRSALKLEITPIEAYDKYTQYKKVKDSIEKFKDFVGIKKPSVDIKVKPKFDTSVPNGDLKNSEVDMPVNKADTFKETLKDISSIIYELGRGVLISFNNILKLIPVILGPVKTIGTAMRQAAKNASADFNALIYETVMPFTREIEGAFEMITGYLVRDTKLERYWVNLFQSDSIVSFKENLKALNDVRKSFKYTDIKFLKAEEVRLLEETLRPAKNLLISLNLIDNRLYSIKYTNLQRLVQYFDNIRLVLVRIYKDVFATKIEPIVAKVGSAVVAYFETIGDAISDILNESIGEKVGKAFIKGFVKTFSLIVSAISKFRSESVFDTIFSFKKNSFEIIADSILNVFNSILDFARGFAKGLYKEIVDSFNPRFISRSFDSIVAAYKTGLRKVADLLDTYFTRFNYYYYKQKIKYAFTFDTSALDKAYIYLLSMFKKIYTVAENELGKSLKIVKKFGNEIKDIFFTIYDVVVGNSYWPDTIDQVVDYTSNLFQAKSTLEKFRDTVLDIFNTIFKSIVKNNPFIENSINSFVDKLNDINWNSAFVVLKNSIAGSILAGMAFAFGDTKLKLSALSYFISIFNFALEGALSALAPVVGELASGAITALSHHVTKGLITTVDAFIATVPSFTSGVLSAIDPVLGSIYELINQIPIIAHMFSNNLLEGILLASAGLALFSKDGRKFVKEMLFGKEKKGKKTQEGLFDYLGAFKDKNSTGIIDLIFPEKKLALAGAALISTALLESVSLVDALSLGLPLLTIAFFGKEGGKRLRDDVWNYVKGVVFSAYKAFTESTIKVLGTESLISRLLQKGLNASSKASTKSAFSQSFSDAFDQFKQLFVNFRANIEDYGKGKISLKEAFTTNKQSIGSNIPGLAIPTLNTTNFKESVKKMFEEFKKIKIGDNTFAQIFVKFKEGMSSSISKIKEAYNKLNIKENLLSIASSIFAGIKNLVKDSTALIRDGLSLLLPIISKFKGIFAAFAAAVSVTAYAASDATTAISQLGSSLAAFLVPVGAVTAALMALGVAVRAMGAFKTGKQNFIDELLGPDFFKKYDQLDIADTADLNNSLRERATNRKDLFDKNLKQEIKDLKESRKAQIAKAIKENPSLGLEDVLLKDLDLDIGRLRRTRTEAFNKAEKEFRDTAFRNLSEKISNRRAAAQADALSGMAPQINAAGLQAVKDYLFGVIRSGTSNLLKFADAMTAVAMSPMLGLQLWKKAIDAIAAYTKTVILSEVVTVRFALANKALAESFAFLKAAEYLSAIRAFSAIPGLVTAIIGNLTAGSLQAGFALLRKGASSLFNLFKGGFKLTAEGATKAGFIVERVGRILAPLGKFFLKPAAIAVGVGSAAGILGLRFFGPGNSFISNLEWAYDKVKEMLGMRPSTRQGRMSAIGELLGPNQAGNYKVDFSAELAQIDYKKLTDIQVKTLLEVGNQFKESIDTLQVAFERQGFLTEEQISSQRAIEEEVRGILARQPVQANIGLGASTDAFVKGLMEIDDSLWTMFKNFIGYVPDVEEFDSELTGLAATFVYIKEGVKSVITYFNSWPAMIGAVIGGIVGAGNPFAIAAGALIGAIVSGIFDFIASGIASVFDKEEGSLGFISRYFSKLGDSLSLFWKLVGGFSGILDGLLAPFNSFIEDAKRGLASLPSDFRKGQAKFAEETAAKPRLYAEDLPKEVNQLLERTFNEFQAASAEVDRLRRRGFTGIEEDNKAEFTKKLNEAEKRLAEVSIRYQTWAKTYGDFGEENYNIKEFNKQMQLLSSEANSLLGLNIGKFAEEFVGKPSDIKELRALIEKARDLKFRKSRSFTSEARNQIQIEEDNVKRQVKATQEAVTANARFETALEFQVKTVGVDVAVDDLRRLAYESENSFKLFNDLSKELFNLNQELANAVNDNAAPEVVREIYERIASAKIAAITTAITPQDINILNKRLQTLGLDQLSNAQMFNISESSINTIIAQIDRVRLAQQKLLNTTTSGKPFKDQIDALRELYEATQKAKIALQQAVNEQVQAAISAGGSAAIVANRIAMATGQEPPKVASTTEAGLKRSNSLLAERSQLLLNNMILNDASSKVDVKYQKAYGDQIIRNNARLLLIDDALAKLEERHMFTFDTLASSLSNVGVEIDKISFSNLPVAFQKELIVIGSQLEKDSRALSDKTAGSFVGPAMKAIVDRQSAAMRRAKDIITSSMKFTGTQLSTLVSDLGIENLENLSERIFNFAFKSKRSLDDLKLGLSKTFDLNTEAGVKSFLDLLKKITKEERILKERIEDVNQTLSTRVGIVNEVFKSSISEFDFIALGENLAISLSSIGKTLKREFQKVVDTGKTTGGQAGRAFLEGFEKLQETGAFLTFFAELRKNTKDALTEGAKASFDRLASVVPNLGIDFKTFTKLNAEQRRNIGKQAANLQMLEKAAELAMTDQQSQILGTFDGGNVQEVLDAFVKQFEADTKSSFEEVYKRAVDPNTAALDDNTKALKDLFSAYTGTPIIANSTEGLKERRLGAQAPSSFYRGADIARERLLPYSILKGISTRDSIKAINPEVDKVALNLSNSEQLKQFEDFSLKLKLATTELSTATGDRVVELQSNILKYQDALATLSESIVEKANRVREAGKAFGSSVIGGIYSSFTDMLKGKTEEGKSVIRTFGDTLLNTITGTVVDTFAKGLLDPFIGKNSAFEDITKKFGESVYGFASSLFSGRGLSGVKESVMPFAGTLPGVGMAEGNPVSAVASTVLPTGDESNALLGSIDLGISALTGTTENSFSSMIMSLGSMLLGNTMQLTQEQMAMAYYGATLSTIITLLATANGFLSSIATSTAIAAIPLLATGGQVKGPGTGTSDSILAALSNGEYVINAKSTKAALPLLEAINAGKIPKFAKGGMIGTTLSMPGVSITPVKTEKAVQQQVFNINVTGDISRQTKSEIMKMIPQIASGVNAQNRESNYDRRTDR